MVGIGSNSWIRYPTVVLTNQWFETLVAIAIMARIEKKGSFVKINGGTVWFKAVMTTCTASYSTLI